jgi:hypothetical protein
MKSQKSKIIRKTIDAALQHPCSVCGERSDAVGSFVPKHPEKFKMKADEAIYFPCCTDCMVDGIDYDFLEKQFLLCGNSKRAQ